MSRWSELHNPAESGNGKRAGTANKGLRRVLVNLKRNEAEFRSDNTPHERTRAHRMHKCDGTSPCQKPVPNSK